MLLNSDALLAARLDAETRRQDMADLRRLARSLVSDIRQRIRSVERMTGRDLRDVPEHLAAWALGHTITAQRYGFDGGDVVVSYPSQSGQFHRHSVLRAYTLTHAQAMAAYLERHFNREWDRSDPALAA